MRHRATPMLTNADRIRQAAALQLKTNNRVHDYGDASLRPVTYVELYLALVYDMLRQLQRCFFSGAFVVEDRNQSLLRTLLAAKARERYPARTSAGTHRQFMKDKRMCERWQRDDTAAACGRQFEIMLPALMLRCDSDGALHDRRNILLFYGFLGPDLDARTSEPVHYVYLKLETSSYASLAHAATAAVHYGRRALKLTEKEKHNLPKRREDKQSPLLTSAADYRLYNCESVQARAQAYDKIMRIGDEFFVPQQISDALQRRVRKTVRQNSLLLQTCPY